MVSWGAAVIQVSGAALVSVLGASGLRHPIPTTTRNAARRIRKRNAIKLPQHAQSKEIHGRQGNRPLGDWSRPNHEKVCAQAAPPEKQRRAGLAPRPSAATEIRLLQDRHLLLEAAASRGLEGAEVHAPRNLTTDVVRTVPGDVPVAGLERLIVEQRPDQTAGHVVDLQ